MKIKQDPITKLWCREDGAVLMPPCRKFPRFRWTFGTSGWYGYCTVWHSGKNHKVYRIIARAFLPNPDNLPTVDHIDRNPANNSVDNLRWADYKTQNDNRQTCEASRAKYGIRECADRKAYHAAYYDARKAELKARSAAYNAAQKAKGLSKRKCPDGKQRWIPKEGAPCM